MSIFSRFKNASKSDVYRMVQDRGNGYYSYNGKLYQSDIVRACIKPTTKALGKAVLKHIRTSLDKDGNKKTEVNPDAYIRMMFEEPNPLMTGQMLQEKVANQLALNANAYILIIRDTNGVPCQLYPIMCDCVETRYQANELFLKFYLDNGRIFEFPYSDIIHLRDDFYSNDVFGDNPGEALTQLMDCVTTMDQGFIKAIKNSGIVKWLLKFSTGNRPEDIKKNTKEFVDTYLNVQSETFGAAGVNNNCDAQRIEPKDYVPNAANMDRITKRIFQFFGINEKIVTGSYTEEEYNAFYESKVEPILTQESGEFTRKLFTRNARCYGNKIIAEASNLIFANNKTKLAFMGMVDRGAMTPNEWRALFNMAPVEGGDKPIRRLDTAEVETKEGEEDGND